jgi:hypothetical protein
MEMIALYSKILSQLNQTVVVMTEPAFDALMQAGTVEQRQRAARELLDVQHARLVLGNVVLADIATRLKENEEAFRDGIETLDEALGRLEDIEAILNAVATVVKIVGRVVTLV